MNRVMKFFLTHIAVLLSLQGYAQRLVDRSGTVSFFSRAPLENIEATNHQVLAVIDGKNGEVAVAMLMRGFKFDKSLMEQHFNENYIESEKYPKATFEGKILDYSPELLTRDGTHLIHVSGRLTIHGVSQTRDIETNLVKDNDGIHVTFQFPVRLKDHEVDIPKVVVANIAEEVAVSGELHFQNTEQ